MVLHEAKQTACHLLENGSENQDEYASFKKRREKVRIHFENVMSRWTKKKNAKKEKAYLRTLKRSGP